MKSIYVHPYFEKRWPVLVMAHRGGGGLAPENTMPAFRQAVAMGVDVLELDVRSTADGAIVVIHDETVDRTTNGNGAVREKTVAELQQLDAGYCWTNDGGQTYPFRGQGIIVPTLDTLLTTFPQMRLNIDIKQHDLPTVDAFTRELVRHNAVARTLVGSFDDATIAAYRRRLLPAVTAAGRRETLVFYLLQRLGLSRLYRPQAQAFQIPEAHGRFRVDPAFVAAAHRQAMEVHIWTVNEKTAMRRLLAWQVDGIMTDYPDRLLALLGEEGSPAATA